MTPTVNVLYLPGTNCQEETLNAFKHVGANPRLRFLADLLSGSQRLDDADILCVPGGFSFGDHVGAGAVAGRFLADRLNDQLRVCQQRLMLCICNGFQTAMRAGVFGKGVALKVNSCGTFQNIPRQPHTVSADNDSPWLSGLAGLALEFPCAHAEGRFVYTAKDSWQPALRYPDGQNPDGSMDNIAGITTPDGLSLGLMDHPERAGLDSPSIVFFENGVKAAKG